MKIKNFLALSTLAAGLAFSVNAVAAKEIKITANDTPYSEADVQKLAAAASGMGVKEPMSLSKNGGSVKVSGSSSTQCTFKVGEGSAPQIQGMSCK